MDLEIISEYLFFLINENYETIKQRGLFGLLKKASESNPPTKSFYELSKEIYSFERDRDNEIIGAVLTIILMLIISDNKYHTVNNEEYITSDCGTTGELIIMTEETIISTGEIISTTISN